MRSSLLSRCQQGGLCGLPAAFTASCCAAGLQILPHGTKCWTGGGRGWRGHNRHDHKKNPMLCLCLPLSNPKLDQFSRRVELAARDKTHSVNPIHSMTLAWTPLLLDLRHGEGKQERSRERHSKCEAGGRGHGAKGLDHGQTSTRDLILD